MKNTLQKFYLLILLLAITSSPAFAIYNKITFGRNSSVANMSFNEFNSQFESNESVEADTLKMDPYLFLGDGGRVQEVTVDGLKTPITATVQTSFKSTVRELSVVNNKITFKLDVDKTGNAEGMGKITVVAKGNDNTTKTLESDVELIANSNPYPELESGIKLVGKSSTRQGLEGYIEYKCVPAPWVTKYGKTENFNVSDYMPGSSIDGLQFGKLGGGNTIYVKYKPNATDKLIIFSITDKTDNGVRDHLCTVPTLIELEDGVLETTLNLNLGRIPAGQKVITSFNSGSASTVSLIKESNKQVLNQQSLQFTGPVQAEVDMKSEYVKDSKNYIPMTIEVNNGHGKINFNLEGYDPLTVDVKDEVSLPTEFKLDQNYPNPFNPVTTIRFSIPVETRHASSLQQVMLKVYDVLGKELATLVNEEKAPGNYVVIFNAIGLPSGIYYCKMETQTFSKTIQMILLK